ncbi:cell wall hydrolase [Sphingomonas hankookensis]|uniref:cell wall hydrolase n=1 Tax=Sphingomonas hankookensis TaxID=563996 RepID=UPI003D302392
MPISRPSPPPSRHSRRRSTTKNSTASRSASITRSKGEPLTGQLAVADVILNRATSGRFPTSACAVLTQRGQFSFVKGGRLPDVDTSRPAWKTAVAIARIARQDLWDSPAEGALFFHARRVSPNWGKTRVASLGNHIFYR